MTRTVTLTSNGKQARDLAPAVAISILVAALGCGEHPTSPGIDAGQHAPALSRTFSSAELIPDQYIVVFRNDVRDVKSTARALALKHGGKLKHTYSAALKGMALELPDARASALWQDPAVAYVEQNQVVRAIAGPIIQTGATVGLDRLDQRFLPLSGTYSYSGEGTGVRVYILDSGINFGHSEFGGRAVLGVDAVGSGGGDCNGRGTHVVGAGGAPPSAWPKRYNCIRCECWTVRG